MLPNDVRSSYEKVTVDVLMYKYASKAAVQPTFNTTGVVGRIIKSWWYSWPKCWMNSQRASSITTAALNTSINPTPNPFLSRQGVVYALAQLQLQPSVSFNLFLPLSPSTHCSPAATHPGIKSFHHTFFCRLNRLLVPPCTQLFTWAGFGHALQPFKSLQALQS